MVQKLKPDVVVMDITLPDISGIETTRRIKKRVSDVAIVALTIHEDEEYFFKMLESGASGYVPKRAAPEELITAIRAAPVDEIYIYLAPKPWWPISWVVPTSLAAKR
jgi:two-component system response regulator NreC